jgi:hypothetical protein
VLVLAPLSASLVVRAAGYAAPFPILSLLEAPQRTPAPVEIGIKRLPWDSLEVGVKDCDGTTAPGALVPVTLGFNILSPDASEIALRWSADLRPVRGGDAVWQVGREEMIATNAADRPSVTINVPMPKVEGTYVLDVRANWDGGAGHEGSRLGRFIRRRRQSNTVGAERKVTLVVLSSKAAPAAAGRGSDVVVDSIDFARVRANRPSATGRSPARLSGHSAWDVPEGAIVEAGRRDRLRGWIARGGSELSALAPAEGAGLAWSAVGLKVAHPGRPHRLTLHVAPGPIAALGVALIVPPSSQERARVLLDACASNSAVSGENPLRTFNWLIWPDSADPILVLVNRADAPVHVGSVELTELAAEPAAAALAETHAEARRSLGIHLAEPHALDRFGAAVADGPDDTLSLAKNLATYVLHCGASLAVLPDSLADRAQRRSLDGQADEDSTGPDRLDLILKLFEERGLKVLLDVRCDGPLAGLPASDSADAVRRGLVRVDGQGVADGAAYHLLHPEVQAALKRRVTTAVAPRKAHASLQGVLVRLGPGPTVLGSPETGLDDGTYGRFIAAALTVDEGRKAPGLKSTDAKRFEARRQYVAGPGRMPWLSWRSREVGAFYGRLAQATHEAAPGAILAVATPVLDDGPAGQESRRAERAGLPPPQAWRAVGIDFDHWQPAARGPIVLRGVDISSEPLAQDLGTHPELDASVASRPDRGLLLLSEAWNLSRNGGLVLTAAPLAEGALGDEALGHAMAVLDARWILLAAAAVSGREERIGRFARVFRALPADSHSPMAAPESGVAARTWTAGSRTYLGLANDTPYTIRVDASLRAPAAAQVDDLGRGLTLEPQTSAGTKRLVLNLAPFGVAAVRIGAPDARVESVTPYPMEDLEAQSQLISARLNRLSQGRGTAGPANSTFEPPIPRTAVAQIKAVRETSPPQGWSASGNAANSIELDPAKPHTGQGSLRLNVRALPASAICDAFPPPGGPSLTLRTWLRTDRSEAKVHVWIEGEADGRSVVRHTEFTAKSEWTELAVRANDLPPSGLDRVRLRFEMMSLGTLWLDDVSVVGQGLSEPERRAQRVLVMAMQAYREKRYADFARLLSSHSARQDAPDSPAQLSERSPADGPAADRTGAASDLSPGRRLR